MKAAKAAGSTLAGELIVAEAMGLDIHLAPLGCWQHLRSHLRSHFHWRSHRNANTSVAAAALCCSCARFMLYDVVGANKVERMQSSDNTRQQLKRKNERIAAYLQRNAAELEGVVCVLSRNKNDNIVCYVPKRTPSQTISEVESFWMIADPVQRGRLRMKNIASDREALNILERKYFRMNVEAESVTYRQTKGYGEPIWSPCTPSRAVCLHDAPMRSKVGHLLYSPAVVSFAQLPHRKFRLLERPRGDGSIQVLLVGIVAGKDNMVVTRLHVNETYTLGLPTVQSVTIWGDSLNSLEPSTKEVVVNPH